MLENTATNHWYRRPGTTGPNPLQYSAHDATGDKVFPVRISEPSTPRFCSSHYSTTLPAPSLPRGRAALETRRWRGGAWRATQPQAPHPGFGSRPPPTTCSSPHGIRWELPPRLAVSLRL